MRRDLITVPFFIPHQGCPNRCVFCDQEKIAGAPGMLPGREEILGKIGQYAASAGGRPLEVAFFGGTFTALSRAGQTALLEPVRELVHGGVVSGVRISTRPDSVDAACASFLREMGVGTVELGVQSMDDEVLHLSGRGHAGHHAESAARALAAEGLSLGVQLMPGLPGDTPRRSLDSLKRALALGPDFLRIYPTLVLAGTELSRLYRQGGYSPLPLEEAVALCKEMLLAALRRAVPVIRMGLQPTSELEAPGVLLAGPYHPAFGQLVESELMFDLLCALVAPLPRGSRVTVLAPSGRTSDVVGQKRGNLTRVAERYAVSVGQVREDEGLSRHALLLRWEGGERRGDLLDQARGGEGS